MRALNVRTPPYQRVQGAAHKWAEVGDFYATNLVGHGLRFVWVPGFDLDNPTDDYQPFTLSPYGRSCSDDVPVLRSEVEKLVLAGHVSDIAPAEAECVCSIFLVEKKPDPDNPQGANRPCTNSRPVNRFISVTYFTLRGVREILPHLGTDYFACKVTMGIFTGRFQRGTRRGWFLHLTGSYTSGMASFWSKCGTPGMATNDASHHLSCKSSWSLGVRICR